MVDVINHFRSSKLTTTTLVPIFWRLFCLHFFFIISILVKYRLDLFLSMEYLTYVYWIISLGSSRLNFNEESKDFHNHVLIHQKKIYQMRFIQFNSGLCVVLRDVQHHQTEQLQEYYLSTPQPTHHSSNSSIATTTSSIKSNGSIGNNNGYYVSRPYPPISHSTVDYQYNRLLTPPVFNTVPSTIIVEVGISISTMNKFTYFHLCVCVV